MTPAKAKKARRQDPAASRDGGRPASAKSRRVSSEVRRRQLIETAMRLFARKGFQGTTTKEIAAAAGINEALIFRHFATKQELYSAILDHQANQGGAARWLDEIRTHAERRDDEAVFTNLARKIIEHQGLGRDFIKLMLYSALEGHELAQMFRERQGFPLHRFLRTYVLLRQREGAFLGLDPDGVARAFIGMCHYHAMINELFGRELARLSDGQAVTTFTRLFLNGLRCGDGTARRGAQR